LALVAAPGTVTIMHSLEVLGYLAGVNAALADSVLVGERLDHKRTEWIIPWFWGLVFGVSVTACEVLYKGCGQRSRSFGVY
jgi:hypothetical protein